MMVRLICRLLGHSWYAVGAETDQIDGVVVSASVHERCDVCGAKRSN